MELKILNLTRSLEFGAPTWLNFAYMGKSFLNVRMRGTVSSLTCLWTISIVTQNKIYSRRFESAVFSKRREMYFVWNDVSDDTVHITALWKKLHGTRMRG